MKKQNIVAILFSFSLTDANSICTLKIMEYMVNRGHDVSVICCQALQEDIRKLKDSGIRVFQFQNRRLMLYSSVKNALRGNKFKRHALGATLLLIQWALFAGRVENAVLTKPFFDYTKQVIISANVNALLSVSVPFENHISAARIKERNQFLKWVAYELDPYTYNYNLPAALTASRSECELKTLEKADKIILTQGIWEENERNNFGSSLKDKVVSLPFPTLDMRITQNMRVDDGVLFDPKKINLLYAGNIYGSFRNPQVMLDIIQAAGDPDLVLHVFGYGLEAFVMQNMFKYGQIVLHGRVNRDEINRAISSASILINLGNKMPNQTPSKVVDYIASGKPIVNFVFSDNDTSLVYLRRYPLHITIQNDEAKQKEKIAEFLNFCKKHRNARISKDVLVDLYEEFLSESVCEKFAKHFEGEDKNPSEV